MIYISGMEDGSGDGSAVSSKAGWLPRQRSAVRVAQAVLPALLRAAMTPPPIDRTERPAPARPRPTLGPDGRPLPPDGSAPPARPQTGPIPATAPTPVAWEASAGSAQSPDGRPLPPAGAAPSRPHRAAATQQRQHAPATRASSPTDAFGAIGTRTPGTPLSPGAGPTAPAGHTFTARPAPAPAGEFLFDVRCSCGGSRRAAVTRADLTRAAVRGLPASEAIAIATQDALDAMHLSPVVI